MQDDEQDNSLIDPSERKSSKRVLDALSDSRKAFREWLDTCRRIDAIYADHNNAWRTAAEISGHFGYSDTELDLFWASFEVLKPAVYARPPKPVVSTMFRDKRMLQSTTAEVLERVCYSVLDRSNIQDVMCHVRDDVIFDGRGVIWLTYETDDGEPCIHVEHIDRNDFAHEPARAWCEVGWVARRAWMTKKDMRKRFSKKSGKAYIEAKILTAREAENEGAADASRKASVWEVWHKADNRVYWVSEGVEVMLDEGEPHLDLKDFFPCPKPAYATLERRSLVPIPDYKRYASHFEQINKMTGRIYLLINQVRMMGLIPGGGDIAEAVEDMMRSEDDQILVKVPAAAMLAANSNGPLVTWLPLNDLAQAITGLIEARNVLIQDFYQLSGISDIMRGATEAEETLGAQQMKAQYGSVRVQEKVREIQRLAADTVRIIAEIVSEKFAKDDILDMAQMEVHTRASIDKRIKEIEKAAEDELNGLMAQAQKQSAQMQQADPQQLQAAEEQFKQAQGAIIQKYAGMLDDASNTVAIEDVMELLRDERGRTFAFEIESDSTILTDEGQEKAARNEFMAQFTSSVQAMMQLSGMGEEGAALAGGMLKFVLGPYRIGRELDKLIEDFIDAAPRLAEQQAAAQNGGESKELIAAQNKLAEAEMEKARAQMAKVEADSQLRSVELQRKNMEMQAKAEADRAKLMAEVEKARIAQADTEGKLAKTMAEIDKLRAETAQILNNIGLDVHRQQLEEYRIASGEEQRAIDNEMAARGEQRADRQQDFSERSGERQQSLAERQAMASEV